MNYWLGCRGRYHLAAHDNRYSDNDDIKELPFTLTRGRFPHVTKCLWSKMCANFTIEAHVQKVLTQTVMFIYNTWYNECVQCPGRMVDKYWTSKTVLSFAQFQKLLLLLLVVHALWWVSFTKLYLQILTHAPLPPSRQWFSFTVVWCGWGCEP